MMIITTIVNVLFYGLIFLRTREDASIFTSSVVVAYVLYLQWSALSSSPTEHCNPFYETNVNTTLQILGGLFFTMMSLLVISSSSKSGEEKNLTA
jgi:Serine incorporator (Serinc)